MFKNRQANTRRRVTRQAKRSMKRPHFLRLKIYVGPVCSVTAYRRDADTLMQIAHRFHDQHESCVAVIDRRKVEKTGYEKYTVGAWTTLKKIEFEL